MLAWLLMNLTLLLWHIPAAYDFALEHEAVHLLEHICFLSTSLLFWWVLMRPWPPSPQTLGWGAPLYLVSADIVNTALAARLPSSGGRSIPSTHSMATPSIWLRSLTKRSALR